MNEESKKERKTKRPPPPLRQTSLDELEQNIGNFRYHYIFMDFAKDSIRGELTDLRSNVIKYPCSVYPAHICLKCHCPPANVLFSVLIHVHSLAGKPIPNINITGNNFGEPHHLIIWKDKQRGTQIFRVSL